MDPRLATSLEGRYTIDREIGRGGMATVYLARDVRHSRNVALKVLNPELGAVLGVERFLAEIQVTANLQHPNLLPLFDSGEANGLLFYVMPYVQGESLRARLEREKQLPVDEAVRITTAIAGALDYAHRHQVIHRDLKPENILMQEGQPLIADFGIALAVSNAGGARITQTGLSLGTPQYMSPEQATGDRVVDGRSDIYSLGAMLYEMLVGDPPHSASTAQAIVAKVLTEKPASVRTSRPSVPVHVEMAIGRALEKLAADRFGTAKEFAEALEGKNAPAMSTAYGHTTPSTGGSRAREIVAWGLVAVLAGWFGWQHLRAPVVTEAPVVRVVFTPPAGHRIADAQSGTTIALSPKGDRFVFLTVGSSTGNPIMIQRVDELTAHRLASNSGRNLTFSPDGRWLAFTEGDQLLKVPVEGGEPTMIARIIGGVPYGLAWSTLDTIYVGGYSGLRAISATSGGGSNGARVDSMGARVGQRWPVLLPGEKAIAFARGSGAAQAAHLSVMDRKSGAITDFPQVIAAPLAVLDDQLIYVSPTGALMALRFDLRAHKPIGDPILIEEGVLVEPTAGAKVSISATGTLAYLRGRAQFRPALAQASSASAPVPMIREPGSYANPRYSPDGRRFAITLFGPSSTQVWVYDIALNTFKQVTTEGNNSRAEWSPNSKDLVFISVRDGVTGIWRQPADGSGKAELLYQPEYEPFETVLSPDGKWLLFRTSPGAKYPRDILAVPMTGEKTILPIATGPETESMPRISPDGLWMTYQSSTTNRFEVYVRPFPGPGAPVQVSDLGGTEPLWSRSGKSLYYRGPAGDLIEVAVTTGAAFSIGARKSVLASDFLTDATHPGYDVAPNGGFLVLKRAGEESQTIIVHNWISELRKKTAVRK
jgi:Tol biopolymer transport system component